MVLDVGCKFRDPGFNSQRVPNITWFCRLWTIQLYHSFDDLLDYNMLLRRSLSTKVAFFHLHFSSKIQIKNIALCNTFSTVPNLLKTIVHWFKKWHQKQKKSIHQSVPKTKLSFLERCIVFLLCPFWRDFAYCISSKSEKCLLFWMAQTLYVVFKNISTIFQIMIIKYNKVFLWHTGQIKDVWSDVCWWWPV